MGRQPFVGVFFNLVVSCAGFCRGIDMDCGVREVFQVVKELDAGTPSR